MSGRRPAGRRPRGRPAGRSGTGPGRRPGCHVPAARRLLPEQLGPDACTSPTTTSDSPAATSARANPASTVSTGQSGRCRAGGTSAGPGTAAAPAGRPARRPARRRHRPAPPADEHGVFQASGSHWSRWRAPSASARRVRTAAAARPGTGAASPRRLPAPPPQQHPAPAGAARARAPGGPGPRRRAAVRSSSIRPAPPAGRPRRPPGPGRRPEMSAPARRVSRP